MERSNPRGVLESFALSGSAAIVTGASSGLGRQLASALRSAGADVMLAARRLEPLADTAEALGCEFEVCDIAEDDARARLIDKTIDRFGAIDILVNNAGRSSVGPAEEELTENFQSVLDTNLVAPFDLCRRVGMHMLERGSGSIINIASMLGLVGLGQIPDVAYAASKGGLINLTRELAAQWARRGVRVNAIAPGYFESEMTATMFADQKSLDWIARRDPMGRPGAIGELDGAVVFLASRASSYVTGHILSVDGGWVVI